MNIRDLFLGIAIVIDDEIDERTANIRKIVSQITREKIPYLPYKSIPDDADLKCWRDISFVLLDWKIPVVNPAATTEGIRTPAMLENEMEQTNINFLKKLKEICFAPVFIFTNEDPNDVIKVLVKNGLYRVGEQNYILVKDKKELLGRTRLFTEINRWVRITPVIYVLKTWDNEYQKAKTKLFHEFYEISPVWPGILWKNFERDGVNKSSALGEILSRNLYSRMAPFSFEEKIMNKRVERTSQAKIRAVFGGERFVKKEFLHNDVVTAGDVFKTEDGVLLNIRPACDCIPNRTGGETVDDVELLLLKGTEWTKTKENKKYLSQYGHFEEIECQGLVFSLADGKTYDFRFKKLSMQTWGKVKNQHIGRLLPPYITRIQQRYAAYLQRQGLVRIPAQAIRNS